MLTDTQIGLLWCGILVLIYLYTRQSPSSRSAGGTAGAGTATAAAAPAAAAAGHPLSEDEVSLQLARTVHALRGRHSCRRPLWAVLALPALGVFAFYTLWVYNTVVPCLV